MAAPPLEAGAVKLTVACPCPAVAVTLVGALGAVTLTGVVAGALAVLAAGVPPPPPQADKNKRPMQPNTLRILPDMNIPLREDYI